MRPTKGVEETDSMAPKTGYNPLGKHRKSTKKRGTIVFHSDNPF